MPGDGDIFRDAVVFGIGVRFESDCEAALNAAAAIYAAGVPEAPSGSRVHVRLEAVARGVRAGEVSQVRNGCLTLARDQFSLFADGRAGEGYCTFPSAAADAANGPYAEMVNTAVLFLVAHAGRIPVHASAVMFGDLAVVLAGKSGSGKSSLALAADRAGLAVLSDDTVYVQTEPELRLWAQPRAIHVFEKDAPPGSAGAMRYRSGRWKRALPIGVPREAADRSALCVIEQGEAAHIERLDVEEAVEALTRDPEPGYELYGERSKKAVRALAREGCWRLTLSRDPADAIGVLRETFERAPSFHERYVAVLAEIESRFPVSRWKLGDVPLWPLARFDLYVDMHRAAFAEDAPRRKSRPARFASALTRPFLRQARALGLDAAHQVLKAVPAHAAFLGDGVTLDYVGGAYQDRFGEPVIAALERQGHSVFLMQGGDLSRLPWHRPTYSTIFAEARGALMSALSREAAELPGHDELSDCLTRHAIHAPSLDARSLARRARRIAATASAFERVLRRVNPKLAFVVNYAAGVGPAFVLACRRLGVLCVDLQRCPLEGAPMAYGWSALPDEGYATLPDVFWLWDAADAAKLPAPLRHRALHGGHAQLLPFLDDASAATRGWDRCYERLAGERRAREILIALQPIGSQISRWNQLADMIETSPADWRWWIRRHPTMHGDQDAAAGRLLSSRRANIVIDPPLPLPALLRHMSLLVSLASGAAVEASMFGVPSLFISDEAGEPFHDLIARGAAKIVPVTALAEEIARLPAKPLRRSVAPGPSLADTLARLEAMADRRSLPRYAP